MSGEPTEATEILWIDEDTYHYVCPDCFVRWGGPDSWEGLLEGWEAENANIYQTLTETRPNCELCQYDPFQLSLEVRQGRCEFNEIPKSIQGDVFDHLLTTKKPDVTIGNESDRSLNVRYEKQREQARELLADELELDKPPKSMSKKRIEKRQEILNNIIDEGNQRWREVLNQFDRSIDVIAAGGYGTLMAEYEIAMSTNLWDLSQSGLMAETLGKLPGVGFIQPFVEEFLRNYRVATESEQKAERLIEEMAELETDMGTRMRDIFEDIPDHSDKELGRFYFLMIIAHHEAMKDAINDTRTFG